MVVVVVVVGRVLSVAIVAVLRVVGWVEATINWLSLRLRERERERELCCSSNNNRKCNKTLPRIFRVLLGFSLGRDLFLCENKVKGGNAKLS